VLATLGRAVLQEWSSGSTLRSVKGLLGRASPGRNVGACLFRMACILLTIVVYCTMENTETWLPILGFVGLYEVSSLGRVRSLPGKRGRGKSGCFLKAGTNSCGYLGVILCRDDRKYWKSVHRLVANAFIDNPEALPFVNHIDHNKLNNGKSNLEWCTAKQNSRHAADADRIKSGLSHPKSVRVRVYKSGHIVGEYDTITDAAKDLGIPYPSLCKGSSYEYTVVRLP
jgi:hypothetical protein